MKKLLMLSVMLSLVSSATWAQNDMYFTPSKKMREAEKHAIEQEQLRYRRNIAVDDYNHRGQFMSQYQPVEGDSLGNDVIIMQPSDSINAYNYYDDNDYLYSRRMNRFDDFYWYYPYWYDSPLWYYNWFYGSPYWYASLYDWGWYSPWYYGYYGSWYRPWGGWNWYGWPVAVHRSYTGFTGTNNHGYRGGNSSYRNSGFTYSNSNRRARFDYQTNNMNNRRNNDNSRFNNNNNMNSTSTFNGSFGNSRGGSFGGGSFGGGSFGGGSRGGFGGGSRGGFGGGRR